MEIAFLKLQTADINNLSLTCKSYREEKASFSPTLSITGNQKDIKSLGIKIQINGDSFVEKCPFSYPSTTWTPSISLANQPTTGWIKISLPQDSFPHDNEYFFTYGNQGLLKVGVQCKDSETEKFIKAVCNLNPQSIYLNKDFSFEKDKLNENDLLIIQGYFSDLEEAQLLKFIKVGGKVVLFPRIEKRRKGLCISKME